MIHRTYVVYLPSTGPYFQVAAKESASEPLLRLQNPPSGAALDIVMQVPGSRAAPVFDPAVYVGVTPNTVPPAGWNGLGTTGWYYEVRSRALRTERLSGTTGFTPRTNLGFHLSITALQEPTGIASNGNLLPMLELSESLAPTPLANASLLPVAYATALPDPSYGPVIRVYNAVSFYQRNDILYLVNFSIAENKDEDFNTLGHA